MCAAATLSLDDEFLGLEVHICSAILEEALTLPISTIAHISRSAKPLLATVLAAELHYAHFGNIWGFVRLQLFAKAVLRPPPWEVKKRRYEIKSLIVDRLQHWKEEDSIISLWNEARSEACRQSQNEGVSVAFSNATEV